VKNRTPLVKHLRGVSRWIVTAGVLFGFWALWGLVSLEWSVDAHAWWAELVFYGFTLLLPTVMIGALVDRWWAPSLALSLLALPLVPGRCVWRQDSADSFGGVCSGDNEELPLQIGVAFAALLAGTVFAVARRELISRRRPPG
jgi:hypothetical protein